MDEARIDAIRREVMGQLAPSPGERAAHDLEARVAALESAVAALRAAVAAPASPAVPTAAAHAGHGHASLRVLGPGGGGGGNCLMEPDKPCVQSHACRTFGH
jgi:hypothetical protein